jgi:hypothetical protein
MIEKRPENQGQNCISLRSSRYGAASVKATLFLTSRTLVYSFKHTTLSSPAIRHEEEIHAKLKVKTLRQSRLVKVTSRLRNGEKTLSV